MFCILHYFRRCFDLLTLAIESSAGPASVAVCSDGDLLGLYFQNSKLTHSRTLLVMADALLTNLDIAIKDIGLVAVACGPGSFTGVRIGVSAAKGLAFGLDIPVAGVSTLESMAYQVQETGDIICPVMDAKRKQVYNALFSLKDGAPARICNDRAISLEALSDELKTRGAHCLLIGDGATIGFEYLSSAGISCRVAPDLIRWQTAYGVALASTQVTPVPAIELEPSYLRPSQAEQARKAKIE